MCEFSGDWSHPNNDVTEHLLNDHSRLCLCNYDQTYNSLVYSSTLIARIPALFYGLIFTIIHRYWDLGLARIIMEENIRTNRGK